MSLTKDTTSHFLELASRHKKSLRDDLIPKVKKVLNENPVIIYNKLNKMARQFYLRGREVLGELHRLNAFIRFKVYPEYLLVSEIRPEHDIIDLMLIIFIDGIQISLSFFTNNIKEILLQSVLIFVLMH
jgi:hypothetical protein